MFVCDNNIGDLKVDISVLMFWVLCIRKATKEFFREWAAVFSKESCCIGVLRSSTDFLWWQRSYWIWLIGPPSCRISKKQSRVPIRREDDPCIKLTFQCHVSPVMAFTLWCPWTTVATLHKSLNIAHPHVQSSKP